MYFTTVQKISLHMNFSDEISHTPCILLIVLSYHGTGVYTYSSLDLSIVTFSI